MHSNVLKILTKVDFIEDAEKGEVFESLPVNE